MIKTQWKLFLFNIRKMIRGKIYDRNGIVTFIVTSIRITIRIYSCGHGFKIFQAIIPFNILDTFYNNFK